MTKRELYKTARAAISCAKFKKDDFVSVEYSHQESNGVHWFKIDRSQHGPIECPVYYPEHHLYNFVL